MLISCLRLSNFENGSQLAPNDARVRNYWAAVTQVPAGWLGGAGAFPMQVLSTSIEDAVVTEVYLTRAGDGSAAANAGSAANGDSDANGGETPGGETSGGLPITGTQMAGILVLALVLFGGGIGLMIARRKRTPAEEPEDELIDGADGSEGPRAE